MAVGLRLWIDDLRPAPGHEPWAVATTSAEALAWLREYASLEPRPHLTEISFDHDLGGEDTTRPVMLWLIENQVWPAVVYVHTANRVGRDWLVGMAQMYGPDTLVVRH